MRTFWYATQLQRHVSLQLQNLCSGNSKVVWNAVTQNKPNSGTMIVLLYTKTEETHVCQAVFQFHFRHVLTNVQKSLDHPGAISLYPIMAVTEESRGRKKWKRKRKLWRGKGIKKKENPHAIVISNSEWLVTFFLITDIYHEYVSTADVRSIFFCSRDVTKTPGSSLLLQLPISRTGLSFSLYGSDQDIVHPSPSWEMCSWEWF